MGFILPSLPAGLVRVRWDRYHRAARGATILLAEGQLQREEGVIHVAVERLEDLSPLAQEMRQTSRDFR